MTENQINALLAEHEEIAERVLANIRQYRDAYSRGQHWQSVQHAEISVAQSRQLINKIVHLFGLEKI